MLTERIVGKSEGHTPARICSFDFTEHPEMALRQCFFYSKNKRHESPDWLYGKWLLVICYWIHPIESPSHSVPPSLSHLLAGFTEAAFALLVVNDGFVQMLFVEIGPQHRCEVQFRISGLPE